MKALYSVSLINYFESSPDGICSQFKHKGYWMVKHDATYFKYGPLPIAVIAKWSCD